MPKYSIIIPVFNAADRITKVMDSVMNQEYEDFELILVCDSCKDKTIDTIKSHYIYPDEVPSKANFEKVSEAGNITKYKKDKTTIIISEVEFGNDGLSRSKGLDLATGEWVLFLDDDDWWLHEYCLSMIDQAVEQVKDTKDLIQFGFIWKGYGYYPSSPNNKNKNGESFLYSNVWTKCFKRSFIGDTRFPNVHSVSDAKFMDEIMSKAPRIAYLDYPIYYYNWLREGSISQKDRSKKEQEVHKVVATTTKSSSNKKMDWSM